MTTFAETLSREALLDRMRDERYLNEAHPEHGAFRRMIADGFRKLYGDGSATPDATGRLVVPDA